MPTGSRWKNRFISTKFYDKEVGVSIFGQKNKKTNKSDVLNESEFKVKRRRAIDLHFLANVLFCSSCKTALSIDSIDKESTKELDSTITRICNKCIPFKTVLSWKTHTNKINESQFDPSNGSTSRKPYYALNHSSVEKFLRTMKVPYMSSKTYVKYQKDVGPAGADVVENHKENVQLSALNCEEIVKTKG